MLDSEDIRTPLTFGNLTLKSTLVFCADWNLLMNEMVIDEDGNPFRKCLMKVVNLWRLLFATLL